MSMPRKYSGKQIIKAGEDLINVDAMNADPERFSEAMDILSYWRFSYEYPLDKAFTLLQEISLKKDRSAFFAKRLKRHISIVRKLVRFNKMKLKNMQDIGGCRVVLTNTKKLYQTVKELRKLPEFKNSLGNVRYKDYVARPKEDGYRSYHLIGVFLDGKGEPKSIELQLRTRMQHYWATTLEIVDLFTDQALKSNQGDESWKTFFIHVSEQFSAMDSTHLFSSFSEQEQFLHYKKKLEKDKNLLMSCQIVQEYFKELGVFDKLNAFAGSLAVIGDQLDGVDESMGYVLLKIDVKNHKVLLAHIFY